MRERVDVYFETLMEEPPKYISNLEKQALKDEVPIIRRATRDLLRYLLHTKQPKKILEIGTAVGYSTLFMKECISNQSTIDTIEKVPARITEAKKNFQEYDTKDQICLFGGDALAILQKLSDEGRSYDFIFMDAAKGQYLNFLPPLLAMMSQGSVLVSDNILHDGDVLESRYAVTRRDRTIHARMREYLHVLTHHEQLETICLSLGDGVTISTRKENQ